MYIAVSLVLLLIIVGLLCISNSLKLELDNRRFHSRHVAIAIVYSIICVLGFSLLLTVVNAFLSIPAVREFLYRISPDVNTAAAFYWIVTLLVNILFMAIFVIILTVLKGVWIDRVAEKNSSEDYLESDDANIIEKFFHGISNVFYDGNKIKPVAENIGVWVRTMKNIFIVLLGIEALALTILLGTGIIVAENLFSTLAKSLYMIPMASYIILSHTEIFLCADRVINNGYLSSDDVGEKVIGDYTPLIKFYESVFGGTALISYYTKGEGDFTESLYAGIDEKQLQKVNNPELLNAIYRSVINGVERVNVKYVDSIVDLVNGKNIAVADSMFGEFNVYFLSYLQQMLALHKKALVVCDTPLEVEKMKKKYEDVLTLINKVVPIWRIRTLEDMQDNNADILICTEEQLINGKLKNIYFEFFKKVSNVVIADSYGLISRDKAFLTRLFNYLNEQPVQYVFNLPENNADIKTVLEEFVDVDVIVYENFSETTNTCIMYWRGESALKTQLMLSTNLINDFGLAYTIGIIGSKFDVMGINVQAPGTVPIYSYKNTATGEYAKVLVKEFLKDESINIESNIRINDTVIFKPKELAFNIVYDANNNLISLSNLWLSYGGRTCSMLHMISRPYMLRDYFAYNLAELCGNASGVKMFVPIKVLNSKASALAFLIKTRRGVYADEITDFAHLNNIPESNAEKVLEILLNIVLGERHNHSVYECFAFDESGKPKFENGEYIYSHIVKMTSQNLYEELAAMTVENAVLSGKNHSSILSINKNDIYNYYLPTQRCSIEGNRYFIEEMRDGELYVKKEETVLEDMEYMPLYNIVSVNDVKSIDDKVLVENRNYSVRFFSADIEREIWGYLEYSNGIDFSENANTKMKKLVQPIRENKHSNYLQISFNYAYRENYERMAALLVVLLRGALETLLPKNYRDLMVVSAIDKEKLISAKVDGSEAEVQLVDDERLLYLYPEIASGILDGNNEGRINIYIMDYSTVETGALSAISDDIDRLLIIIKNYLNWAISKNDVKNPYLQFGLDSIPSIFAENELSSWLENITSKIVLPDKIINGNFTIAASRYCSFCGKPIVASGVLLADGRVMCESCARHRMTKKKDVKVLLKKAYNIIEGKYGVELPTNIRITFARKEVVESDAGKNVLGYYYPAKNLIKVVKGGPETNVLSTLIHELVHAWQWKKGNVGHLSKLYKEGHSVYVEIECLRGMGEATFADMYEKARLNSSDEYGEGLRFWQEYIESQSDKNIFHHIVNIEEE